MVQGMPPAEHPGRVASMRQLLFKALTLGSKDATEKSAALTTWDEFSGRNEVGECCKKAALQTADCRLQTLQFADCSFSELKLLPIGGKQAFPLRAEEQTVATKVYIHFTPQVVSCLSSQSSQTAVSLLLGRICTLIQKKMPIVGAQSLAIYGF